MLVVSACGEFRQRIAECCFHQPCRYPRVLHLRHVESGQSTGVSMSRRLKDWSLPVQIVCRRTGMWNVGGLRSL